MQKMALMREKLFRYFRFLAAFALLSCISPLPDVPAAKTATSPSAYPAVSSDIKLVIWKSHYTLTVYRGDIPVKTYRTVFGRGYRDGDKRMMGDRRTPEGDFYICTLNRSKRFYKFMGLSYPGLKHAEYGLRSQLISTKEYELIKKAVEERRPPPWDTQLGGAVGIHGVTLDKNAPQRNILSMNWTDGCIALDNADIDELFSMVSLGTPVTILP
jgi:murein L,D-transpeptidase YafK